MYIEVKILLCKSLIRSLFFFFTDGSDGWHQHEHGKGQHHHHQHHHHHHHHHQEQQKGGDHHLRQRRHEWSPSQAIHEKQSNVIFKIQKTKLQFKIKNLNS